MDCPKDLPVLHCKKREIIRKLTEGCDEEVHKKYSNAPVQRESQRLAYYVGVSLDTVTRIWQICREKLIDPQGRPVNIMNLGFTISLVCVSAVTNMAMVRTSVQNKRTNRDKFKLGEMSTSALYTAGYMSIV